VFIIGIDPHKGSHTAVAIDGDERLVGELLVRADRRQRERLLCWAAEFERHCCIGGWSCGAVMVAG
jgi:transposase